MSNGLQVFGFSSYMFCRAVNILGIIGYMTVFDIIDSAWHHNTKLKSNSRLLIAQFLFSTTWKLPQAKYLLFGKPCYSNQLVALGIHPPHEQRVPEHAVCIH